jgi:trimeric autotransporter adhesin
MYTIRWFASLCLISPWILLLSGISGCTDPGVDWDSIDSDPLSPNVALWNGSSWESLGDGLDSVVFDVAFGDDGTLYAGGRFARSGERSCPGVARWSPVDRQWTPLGNGVNGNVRAIAFNGSSVYVGGHFAEAYNPDGSVVRVNNIAEWDGNQWHDVGAGVDDAVFDMTFTHGALYVGTAYHLYRLDPVSRIGELLADFDKGAKSLEVFGDSLFIGGWFDATAHSQPSGVVVLNLQDSSWRVSDYLANKHGNTDGQFVWDLAVSGSTLFIGGWFWTTDNQNVTAVSLSDGKAHSMTSLNDYVYALAADESYLYAGGMFWEAGASQELIRAGRFNLRTSRWEPMGRGLSGIVQDIAIRGNAVVFAGEIGGAIR